MEKVRAKSTALIKTQEKTTTEKLQNTQEQAIFGFGKYVVLFTLLAFIGWAFEVGVMFVQTGKFYNQGFNTLPVCPIYAFSLLACYFLVGTPDTPKGLLHTVKNKKLRYFYYFLFAFLVPTLAELIVGAFFDNVFSIKLWSYAGMFLNFRGYICLPVSLAWSGLIFFFMKYIFPALKTAVSKLPNAFAGALAFSLTLILLTDFSLNIAYLLYK